MYQIINETTVHGITKRVVVDKEVVYPTLQSAKDSIWHKLMDGMSVAYNILLMSKSLEERKETCDLIVNSMDNFKAGQGAQLNTFENIVSATYYDTAIVEKWIIQELQLIHSNE